MGDIDQDRVQDWLAGARADAERRGQASLVPLLESLAAATAAIRRADWNDEAAATPGQVPPIPRD